MRIAATSDIHGTLDDLEASIKESNPDVLVIAGDIHPCEFGVHANEWFRRQFFPMIARLSCKVVAIPGNHDFWLASHFESFNSPPNFACLVDRMLTIDGINFWGTPWVPYISGHWCFESEEGGDDMTDFLKEKFSLIPDCTDILITHSPMRFAETDYSLQRDPYRTRPFGSISLLNRLKQMKRLPKVHLCGHIHSGDHSGPEFKNDVCPYGMRSFNVSRVDERYLIGYPILLLEVDEQGRLTKVGTASRQTFGIR